MGMILINFYCCQMQEISAELARAYAIDYTNYCIINRCCLGSYCVVCVAHKGARARAPDYDI